MLTSDSMCFIYRQLSPTVDGVIRHFHLICPDRHPSSCYVISLSIGEDDLQVCVSYDGGERVSPVCQ